ncbi:MAG: T9SS type A sorting domain-containing protein [Bacteroidetes bacterium]|nr:T9SS type A sorting domain-containing protein [Bacteroidota bacterium]
MKYFKFFLSVFVLFSVAFTLNAQPTVNITNPVPASTGVTLTPTLEWSIGAGTPPYNSTVYIYTDGTFSTLLHTANVGVATSYAVPGGVLQNNWRYWWIVEVTDGAFIGSVTASANFTTLLATPVLASPADAYISNTMTPTLSWTMDDNKGNVRYRLLTGTSPGLTVGANLNSTTGVNPGSLSTTPLALLPATKYWWTINAEVSSGTAANNGETAQAATERTFYTPLDVLTTPINGVTGHTLEPTFAWTDVNFETEYELRISTAGGSQVAFDAGLVFTDLAIPANSTSVIYNENTLNEGPGSTYPFPLNANTTYYWQLVAKDGSVSVPSPIWHFTTYPVVTVSQFNPANGDIVYLNDVIFSYGINQATNDLKFKLQVKSALVPPVKTDWLTSNFTGTSVNLNQTVNLLGGTKYYWRVVLLNNSNQVMAYSPTSYFTTSGGATVPYPSWPIGNPKVYTNSPQLYWYTAGYSADITFDVQVKLLPLGVPVYSATNITNIYHQISTNLLPGTMYYWQVRSVYKRGTPDEQTSAWSADNTFTTWGAGTLVVPNPSYPVDNLLVYTTSPYLYWWLGQDGTGLTYDIRYGTDPTLTVYASVAGVTNLFHQLSNLVPGATYYWQVRSNNGSSTSAFSAIQSFSIAGGVANGFTVLNWPTGNPTVYTTTPTLSWYLEGSPMGITGYHVRWKTGSNSSNWDADYTGFAFVGDAYNTSYTFSVPFAEGQVVYWAVAATNGITHSAWSSDHFTIYSGATPGAPVISWPSGNALIYTVDPQLNWWVNGSTSGIVGYQVVYSYSDVFAPAATTTAYSTSTSLNVTGLVEGATYWWKVRAHLGGMSYGAFSAVESFTVNPGSFAPVTPIVGGPNNVMISTTTPILSWALPAAPPAGAKFELEVADNSQFTGSTVFNNLTANNKMLQGLTTNKSYFWRVRTKTSDGSYSFYSGMGKFNVMDGATDVKEVAEIPKEFNLDQNYPNPFNPSTNIRFALPADANVKLDVYNTLGEKVAELLNGPMTAGNYAIAFNASALPSGIYFYRIEAGSNIAVRKMILMK